MKEILLNKTDGFDSRLASVSRLLLERGSLLKRLLRDRTALIGLLLVAGLVSAAVLAPWLAPNDPAAIFPEQKFAASSRQFPLGTDNLGRCLLSRLMFGARVSLLTAGTASLLIMLIGVAVGTVAGYFGGLIDFVLMRLVDLLLAFPLLVLALAVTGMLGVGLTSVLIGVVSVWWASYARIVRALTISLRERQFIEAARATGISDSGIVLRHIIPNIIASIIVLSTIETGRLLLVISGISFLGLGVQPPTPEWGAMLNDGRAFLQSAPQLMIYPGLAICLTVLGLNLLGDSLRDELDPRL
jgi:peptide/nickel transport system permease protein